MKSAPQMKLNPPIRRRGRFHPQRGFHRRRRFIPPGRVDLVEKDSDCITIRVLFWYGRQDLNLHGNPLEPKSNVSANSTTPAFIKLFALLSCCGTRQPLRLSKQTCALPTAATRSGRFFRHRRRSHRSPTCLPIPPRPHIQFAIDNSCSLSLSTVN